MRPIDTDMTGERLGGRLMSPRLTLAASIISLIGLFALLDAGQTYLGFAWEGTPRSFGSALFTTTKIWVLFGVLSLPAIWLSSQYRLDDGAHTSRNIAIHTTAAFVFAIAHLTGCALVNTASPVTMDRVASHLWRDIRWLFAATFLVYWAILGAVHAVLLYREAKKAVLQRMQSDVQASHARLEGLQAQLRPHFLFNTLNTISVLAATGQHSAVVRTVDCLSQLLRVVLDETLAHQVPLADELHFVRRYLDIQRTRFPNQFSVEEDVDADTLDALVPTLLLQPIVENAVVHGVSLQDECGRLKISARRSGERLRITVSDTGPGFSSKDTLTTGIGLRNTRARLVELYEDRFSLEHKNCREGGTIVAVSIPFVAPSPEGSRVHADAMS